VRPCCLPGEHQRSELGGGRSTGDAPSPQRVQGSQATGRKLSLTLLPTSESDAKAQSNTRFWLWAGTAQLAYCAQVLTRLCGSLPWLRSRSPPPFK